MNLACFVTDYTVVKFFHYILKWNQMCFCLTVLMTLLITLLFLTYYNLVEVGFLLETGHFQNFTISSSKQFIVHVSETMNPTESNTIKFMDY